jgi:hypothetical protein
MAKKTTSIAADDLSPVMSGIIKQLATADRPKRRGKMEKREVDLAFIDPAGEEKADEKPTLFKSILNVLDGGPSGKNNIERLAFESDPSISNQYSSLYRAKLRLIPDVILKRISIQDDLVAAIVNARSNHLSAFGRARPDRFSLGFVIEPQPGILDKMSEEQTKELQDRIDAMVKKLATCGDVKGWGDNDRMTFAQYLYMSTRNAMTVGRIATEVIYVVDREPDSAGSTASARPTPAPSTTPRRRRAPSRPSASKPGTCWSRSRTRSSSPRSSRTTSTPGFRSSTASRCRRFGPEEMLVHNFYPVTHIELQGYPLTPMDTAISAITTHINITTTTRCTSSTGRAARGMLVIKSDDVDEEVVQAVKQQFNASINAVNNAWRMPVFGIGQDETCTWVPIDQGSRDMEFQYLADSNARTILAAFQMSPEELPGYQHLSRGTNNQALSESNNEYKLTAARDVGIRRSSRSGGLPQRLPSCRSSTPTCPSYVKLKLIGLDIERPKRRSRCASSRTCRST